MTDTDTFLSMHSLAVDLVGGNSALDSTIMTSSWAEVPQEEVDCAMGNRYFIVTLYIHIHSLGRYLVCCIVSKYF